MATDLSTAVATTKGIGIPAAWADAAIVLAVAVVPIALAPLLHIVSLYLAVGVLATFACGVVAVIPAYAPVVAIVGLLFQNIFVSLWSPVLDPAAVEFIKGYNFLVCAVMWLATVALFILGQRDRSPPTVRLMKISSVALAAVLLYFVLGALENPMAATIYLRNIVLPIFLFQLALLTAASMELRIKPALMAIAIVFIVCGYIELTFRDFWLDVTHGYSYWRFEELKATDSGVWEREMRRTGAVAADLKDRFKFGFLNTPLLDGFGLSEILRIFGPNISAISYGYGVAFFALFLFSVGHPVIAVISLPLLVLCSVKGALILLLFVSVGWLATRLIGAVLTLAFGLAALVVYVLAGIYVGLNIGDYHVLGFMGGINGFLQAPWGRGLGIGGNLSEGFDAIDWSAAQQAGAVNGAVESAVGVLLYQMGLAALVPLAFYFYLALRAWRLYAYSGIASQGQVAFGICAILANGVFQEEALFAPPALGLLVCLSGIILGTSVRAENLEAAQG